MKKHKSKSFTLIELSIVMAIIGVLATGIIVAVNPGAQFAKTRDMSRKENLERIYSAIQNKLLSEGGAWTDCKEIPFEPTYIGKGKGNYDLYSCLIPKYLTKELYDPQNGNTQNSGYEIWRTGLGEIGLRAKRERPPGYIIVGALPNLPIVTTIKPKNISDVSAQTGGKIYYQGNSKVTERGIVFDTAPRPTVEDKKISAGSGSGEFEVNLYSLEPETTYYVRAYAINASGTAYGQEYSFQTQTPTFPRVKTDNASEIKVHSATLNGQILSLGKYSSVKAYFQYRKKGENGWPFSTAKVTIGQTGSFLQSISGLNEETTYEFRFAADYSDGSSFGNTIELKTASANPVIETLPAQQVTWNSAVLKANLISLGLYSKINAYFVYRKSGQGSWLMTTPITLTAPKEFSAKISGLSPKTQYEFKAMLDYNGKTKEGKVKTLSTLTIPPPVVETLDTSSNIQPGSLKVILKGNLISLGGYNSVNGYFRYRRKGDTNWQETPKLTLTKTGYFTQALTNLSINTTYEFEAIVNYSGKTTYGGASEFTTPIGDARIETAPAEVIGRAVTLKGNLTTLGVYSQALVYFKFKKLGTTIWYQTQKATMTKTGTFEAKLTTLESDTTYQFQALADYDSKTVQGYILQFTTEKSPVQIETLQATNITVETATLNGKLNSLGDYSQANVYFKFRKKGSPNWQETQKVKMTALGNFQADLSKLEINTTYEFEASADYDGKVVTGQLKTFFTPKEGAKVSIQNASQIEIGSVILNGKVTYLYGYPSIDVYFEYREVGGTQSWSKTSSQTLYGTESFNQSLLGLKENTKYEFRAVGEYTGHTVYSETLTFSTLTPVKIETYDASGIQYFKATLNGKVTSLGSFSNANVYFQYRKKGQTNWSQTQKTAKTQLAPFSLVVPNLSSNTTYEFRAMAEFQNKLTGKKYVTNGQTLQFTTPKVPVVVKTLQLASTDFTGNTATLRGKITSMGDYSSAKIFFRYKQPNTPWYQTQKTQISGPVEFYADISNLSPNTQVQYQALAEYSSYIAKGDILTFTTDPEDFKVETKSATNIHSNSATLNGEVTSLGIYHQAQVYFKYKKSRDTSWQTSHKITVSQKGNFSINVNNLTELTSYQFKAMADYDGKTWQSSIISSFSTIGPGNTHYRRPIIINNSNSHNLTNYQVLVSLNTHSLISAGKMRSNCADIRFTNSDGTSLINYWVESGCNTSNTRIWVKVPLIPARSKKTIYIYYGNPSLGSLSNKKSTFVYWQGSLYHSCSCNESCAPDWTGWWYHCGCSCSTTFRPSNIGYSGYYLYDAEVNLTRSGDYYRISSASVYKNGSYIGSYSYYRWPKWFYKLNSSFLTISTYFSHTTAWSSGSWDMAKYQLTASYLRKYSSPEPRISIGQEQ